MQNPKVSLEARPDGECRWCCERRDIFRGFCTSCDNLLRRKWRDYEAAMKALINCEQSLFDMSFAAAYGLDLFSTDVFKKERLALGNVQDSHMTKMAEYYSDLRAGRIDSINRCLPTTSSHRPAPSINSSSVPRHPSDRHSVTTVTQRRGLLELRDDDDPLEKIRAKILVHWSNETDPRALVFINESMHTRNFLQLLLKLAPFYSWEETTRMVNSMTIERIRHGENKQRCHIRDDFWNVYKICRDLEFAPTNPDAITGDELQDVNCRIYQWGLLKDGYDHSPDADSHGVCAKKRPACEAEQAPTAFVFTSQYRNRCHNLGLNEAAASTGHQLTGEGYGDSVTGRHERTNSQYKNGSSSQGVHLYRRPKVWD